MKKTSHMLLENFSIEKTGKKEQDILWDMTIEIKELLQG